MNNQNSSVVTNDQDVDREVEALLAEAQAIRQNFSTKTDALGSRLDNDLNQLETSLGRDEAALQKTLAVETDAMNQDTISGIVAAEDILKEE